MNILITGGAGYIGSILTKELLDEGHRVQVLDNFRYEQTSLLDITYRTDLHIVRGDVRDERLYNQLIQDNDCIIPLACLVGAPLCQQNAQEAEQVNLKAIEFLVKKTSKDQLIIFPCTNSGYGIGQDNLECDEKSPINPISLYGKLKVQAEQHVLEAHEGACFRFATLFGLSPRMRLDLLVNDFVFRAKRDRYLVLFESHFIRNYLHVRDAVNAFKFAIQNYSKMQGQTFNVGLSDANLSKKQLCQVIKEYIPDFTFMESEILKDLDQRNYIVSNKKIESLGFRPQYSLEDGIKELIKGFEVLKRPFFANF